MPAPPPQPPEIRRLRPEDSLAEFTALLHRAYARLGALGLNITAVDQTEATTRARIGRGTCLVATLEERVVGTICIRPHDPADDCVEFRTPGLAIIEQFAVEPALQGHGIGSLLFDEAERIALERRSTVLALDTAEPAVHLVRWYESRGWRVSDHTQWRGKRYRSVVMTKPLPAGPS